MANIPNLAGVASKDLVEKIGWQAPMQPPTSTGHALSICSVSTLLAGL